MVKGEPSTFWCRPGSDPGISSSLSKTLQDVKFSKIFLGNNSSWWTMDHWATVHRILCLCSGQNFFFKFFGCLFVFYPWGYNFCKLSADMLEWKIIGLWRLKVNCQDPCDLTEPLFALWTNYLENISRDSFQIPPVRFWWSKLKAKVVSQNIFLASWTYLNSAFRIFAQIPTFICSDFSNERSCWLIWVWEIMFVAWLAEVQHWGQGF